MAKLVQGPDSNQQATWICPSSAGIQFVNHLIYVIEKSALTHGSSHIHVAPRTGSCFWYWLLHALDAMPAAGTKCFGQCHCT